MKPGRNDPCPCGSGKKFKLCCLSTTVARAELPEDLTWRRIQRANEGLIPRMMNFVMDAYGEDSIEEAWDEFLLWGESEDMDWYGSPHQSVFMPWLLHRWFPDPNGGTTVTDVSLHTVSPTRAFLDRHARRIEPATQRYLEACLTAPFTFYEILDYERDHHFVARELISGQELTVLERSATRSMQKGHLLFGSIVQVDGIAMLEACAPVVIPPIDKLPLIEARKKFSNGRDLTQMQLAEWDIELRTLYLSISEHLLNPPRPELLNTDGEELSLQRLRFDIDAPQEAFDALKHLSLDAPDDELLTQVERAGDGRLLGAKFYWLKRGNKQHAGWETTSLGQIEIDQFQLTAVVNSQERADEFKRIVEKALGSRARFRIAEIEPEEKFFEDDEEIGDWEYSQQALADLPEVQAAIRGMMTKHYDDWLTTKLPALNGKTPFQAIRQPDGREMVEALISQIEADGRRMTPPLDEAIPTRLREKLGLSPSK